MKNNIIYFLSYLVLTIGLASCSDDDSNNNALLLSVSIVDGEKQDVALGKSLTLEAKVENGENARLEWTVDGEKVSTELKYVFTPTKAGTYDVKFAAYKDKDEAYAAVLVNVYVAYDAVKSMSDIQFWTGEGECQSALGVQWISGDNWEDPTQDNVHFLSWGYRWKESDQSTGYQMILAIAKADPRFFVVMGPGFGGDDSRSIRGFGYDADGDGRFSIKNESMSITYDAKDFTDGVIFLKDDVTGDGFVSTDPADYWMGGWYENYCSYYLGDDGKNVPESFEYSPYMADLRTLTQNSWDAWTCSPNRQKYITGRNLGTLYEENHLLQVFQDNSSRQHAEKSHSTDRPVTDFSEKSKSSASIQTDETTHSFLFIKSDLRLVTKSECGRWNC